MASLSPAPKLQFFSAAGVPLVGGKVYSYEAGTTTPLATYTSSAGDVENPNPVILNSRGEGEIWLSSAAYKLVLKDSNDVEIWSVDNIVGAASQADLQALIASLSSSSGSNEIGFIQGYPNALARTAQSKMREWVSVLDFGADPTGTTDSRAAIQLALDSGAKCILFPEGTYIINSLSPYSPVPTFPYDNLNCFCLYLTGDTDIELIGFGATLLRTNSPINCSKYQLIHSESSGRIIIKGFHAIAPDGGPVIGIPATNFGYFQDAGLLTLEDISTATCGGFEIFSCKNVTVTGCYINGGIDQLSFDVPDKTNPNSEYTDKVLIQNNIFEGVLFDVIDLNNAVSNCVIDGNVFKNAYTLGILAVGPDEFIDIGGEEFPIRDVVVSNNVMVETTGNIAHFVTVKQFSQNISITDNVMIWRATAPALSTVTGVLIEETAGICRISGNTFYGLDWCIRFLLQLAENLVITNNSFINFRVEGFYIEAKTATITDNVFVVTDSSITGIVYCMRIDIPDNIIISNNRINLLNNANSIGIRYNGSGSETPGNITGNQILNCGVGILHAGGSARYSDNVISSCYGSAFISGSGKNVLFNNNLMTDNFRNGQDVVIQSLTCKATAQFSATSNVVCNSNFIGEVFRNTEIGKIFFDPTDTAVNGSLLAVGNMISADCSVRQIHFFTSGFTNQLTASNMPTAVTGT